MSLNLAFFFLFSLNHLSWALTLKCYFRRWPPEGTIQNSSERHSTLTLNISVSGYFETLDRQTSCARTHGKGTSCWNDTDSLSLVLWWSSMNISGGLNREAQGSWWNILEGIRQRDGGTHFGCSGKFLHTVTGCRTSCWQFLSLWLWRKFDMSALRGSHAIIKTSGVTRSQTSQKYGMLKTEVFAKINSSSNNNHSYT